MQNRAEMCDNCGCVIGNLETPHIHDDHVVCADCYNRLNPLSHPISHQQTVAYVNPYQHPIVVQFGQSGLGIASFTCGIIAWLGLCIPVAGILFAGIGLLFGFCGLVSTRGKGLAVAGIVLNFIALIPAILLMTIFAVAVVNIPTTDTAATRPATTRPATTRPAATRPAATRPAATRPAATRPAATRPAQVDTEYQQMLKGFRELKDDPKYSKVKFVAGHTGPLPEGTIDVLSDEMPPEFRDKMRRAFQEVFGK